MWLLCNQKKHVPSMGMMEPVYIKHIDLKGRRYSKMKHVMAKIEKFGKEDNVWHNVSEWNGKHVTTLWLTFWQKLDPYLLTETQCVRNDKVSKDKSRKVQISWRSCYNKIQAQGLFAGNKIRKKRRKN